MHCFLKRCEFAFCLIIIFPVQPVWFQDPILKMSRLANTVHPFKKLLTKLLSTALPPFWFRKYVFPPLSSRHSKWLPFGCWLPYLLPADARGMSCLTHCGLEFWSALIQVMTCCLFCTKNFYLNQCELIVNWTLSGIWIKIQNFSFINMPHLKFCLQNGSHFIQASMH